MAFDPDAYVATIDQTKKGFDPDSYLQQKQSEATPSQVALIKKGLEINRALLTTSPLASFTASEAGKQIDRHDATVERVTRPLPNDTGKVNALQSVFESSAPFSDQIELSDKYAAGNTPAEKFGNVLIKGSSTPFSDAADIMSGNKSPLTNPDEPIIPIPEPSKKFIEKHPWIGGSGKGASDTISALTTPRNVDLMMGLSLLPEAPSKLVGLGFAAQIARQMGTDLGTLSAEKDPAKKAELATKVIANGIMETMILNHSTARDAVTPEQKAAAQSDLENMIKERRQNLVSEDAQAVGLPKTAEALKQDENKATPQQQGASKIEAVKPEDKTTGEETPSEVQPVEHKTEPPSDIKPTLDELGVRYDGVQEGYKDVPATHQITIPDTRDTINVPTDATPEEITQRVEQKREAEKSQESGKGDSSGPGAAAYTEGVKEVKTSTKNATVSDERESRGEDPIEKDAATSHPEEIASARAAIKANPNKAESIVEALNSGKTSVRKISVQDEAILLLHKVDLMKERENQKDILHDGTKTPEEHEAASNAWDAIERKINEVDRATKASGSEWGKLGALRQRTMKADYSLEAMERRKRADLDRPLTREESAKIKAQSEEMAQLQKNLKEAQDAATTSKEKADLTDVHEKTISELQKQIDGQPKYGKEVFEIARGIVDRWKADAEDAHKSLRARLGRTSAGVDPTILIDVARIARAKIGELGLDFTEASAQMIAEYGEAVKPYLEKAWAKAKALIEKEKASGIVKDAIRKGAGKSKDKTPQDIKARAKAESVAGEDLSHKTVSDLYRAHVKSEISKGNKVGGIEGANSTIKAVTSDLKEAYPDITERQVSQIYTEYGKAKFPSREADRVALSEYRRIGQLQESIDRLKEGQDALKTGLQRDKASQAIREKQKELNELLKSRKPAPSEEKILASRDQAKQTALKNRIADLDKQLRTGEKPQEGKPALDSVQTEALRAERDAMVEKLKEIEDASKPVKNEAEKQVEKLSKVKGRLDEVLSGERDPKSPKPFNPLSQAAEDIKAEILAMHELAAQMRRDAKPSTDPNAAREKAQIKALEDSIKKYEEKTAKSDFSTKDSGAPRPDTEKVAQLREIRDARKAVYDAAKKASKPVLTPEERYNATRQKVIEKQLAEVQDRLKNNRYDRPPKRVTPAKTPETIKAESELGKARNRLESERQQDELNRQNKFQKFTRFISNLNRANVLGHISVLEHLAGAAVENLATRPVRTAMGQLFRFNKTLEAIRKKAIYEGGTGGEKSGLVATIKSGKAVLEKLKFGDSALDWMHTDGKTYPHSFLDYVSNVHGAIKEPVRQGIYARSMEIRTQAAEAMGLDPASDPVLAHTLSTEAYNDANLDIFQGDNLVAQMHNAVDGLLRKNKQAPGIGRFTADVLNILAPVVKVSTNIAIAKFRMMMGLPEAAIRIGIAAAKGELKNNAAELSPKDADIILRATKWGMIGVPLTIYAWTHANQFGGVIVPGKNAPKDKGSQLKPGEIALPGGNHISHHLLHGPVGSQMNMIADGRRVWDEDVKKNGKWSALTETAAYEMLAAVNQLPAFSAAARLTSPFKSAGQKVGEQIRQMAIFGGIQDLAGATDKEQREPKTFFDEIEVGIPGLRQNVPVKRRRRK